MNRILAAALFPLLALAAASAPAAFLVKEGKPAATIVLPAEPREFEALAAKELADVVEKMSGARLEAVKAAAPEEAAAAARRDGKTPVLLGRAAGLEEGKWIPAEGTGRGAFVLLAGADRVSIAGPEEGTYYGVLELLEQQGARWFMPGPLGEVIPEKRTVEVAAQETSQAPGFGTRWFQMPNREWQLRVRCGGEMLVGAHGMPAPPFKRDKATGEWGPKENAEYWSLIKGKREGRQLCVSNPKLLDYVVERVKEQRKAGKGPVVALAPNDGRGFCECAGCRALDSGETDPYDGVRSVTDRYVWFFNRVLERVLPEYPDTRVATYVYACLTLPPRKEKPNPRINAIMAPINFDRVHGFSNPLAPEKKHVLDLYRRWLATGVKVYDRGYWSNLACVGLPFISVHRVRDEIPICHKIGLAGWRVQTYPYYAAQFPTEYVAARLMWNPKADVDALLKDCFEKFYGPAAAPMGQYAVTMDAALRDADFSTGSDWDMPNFYPPALRKKARALLDEGAKLASGKGIYAERVKVITDAFDMLEAFIGMMDARVRVDFVEAKAQMDRLDAIAYRLMAMTPVAMLDPGRGANAKKQPFDSSGYVYHMERFFRPCTAQGHARMTGGNRLAAAARDEWQFRLDPKREGEGGGWWRPAAPAEGWKPIKTSSLSWSDQGLRYWRGLAWYRQEVEVPAEFDGKRLFLWFGGVDEFAKVWLNGQAVGLSHGRAMVPFELDATPAAKPGKNTVVVCVQNDVVNELGTGGIVAPVFLYAPAKGAEAKLENTRELKTAFPEPREGEGEGDAAWFPAP